MARRIARPFGAHGFHARLFAFERNPSSSRAGLAAALVVSTLALPATAFGDPAPDDPPPPRAGDPSRPVAVDLSLGTTAPVSVGADVGLELPRRVLLSAHLGWMPNAYVELINATATGFDWYNEATATLVEAAVDRSFVFRLSAGFRPFEEHGFELWAGYTLVTAGGGIAGSELIEEASGQMVDRAGAELPVSSTLHALHGSLGWRWLVKEHYLFRVGIGWVHTVASKTNIGRDDVGREGGAVERALAAAESYMDDDVFGAYGFSATARVTAGYRF